MYFFHSLGWIHRAVVLFWSLTPHSSSVGGGNALYVGLSTTIQTKEEEEEKRRSKQERKKCLRVAFQAHLLCLLEPFLKPLSFMLSVSTSAFLLDLHCSLHSMYVLKDWLWVVVVVLTCYHASVYRPCFIYVILCLHRARLGLRVFKYSRQADGTNIFACQRLFIVLSRLSSILVNWYVVFVYEGHLCKFGELFKSHPFGLVFSSWTFYGHFISSVDGQCRSFSPLELMPSILFNFAKGNQV